MDLRLLLRFFLVLFCVDCTVSAPPNTATKKMSIRDECLAEMKLEGKTLYDLKPEQLIQLIGNVEMKYSGKIVNLERNNSNIIANLERNNSNTIRNLERNYSNIIANFERSNSNTIGNLERNYSNIIANLERNYSNIIANLERNYSDAMTALKYKTTDELFYRTLFGLRKRIEYYEALLYPKDFIQTRSRYWKWIIILTMVDHGTVSELLRTMKVHGLTIREFASAMSSLYSEDSKIVHMQIDMPLCQMRDIEEALDRYKVNMPRGVRIAIEVMLKQARPFSEMTTLPAACTPSDQDIQDIKYHRNKRCLLMNSFPFGVRKRVDGTKPIQTPTKQNYNTKLLKKIKAFFKPKSAQNYIVKACECIDTYQVQDSKGNVVVQFATAQNMIAGLLEHNEKIDGFIINPNVVECDEWLKKCSSHSTIFTLSTPECASGP